jgi:hypothetical protein
MTKRGQRLHVVPGPAGWVLRPENKPPVANAPTQAALEQIGRRLLNGSSGGGQLITHRQDGRIRSSDTINRPDPNPPIDREH